jgi:Fe-S cluster biogenesis protein NfuA
MLKEKVEKVIEDLRKFLQADGGDIELVGVDEAKGEVQVKLKGACAGCPMAQITLTQGVEARIKEELPEIKKVVAV